MTGKPDSAERLTRPTVPLDASLSSDARDVFANGIPTLVRLLNWEGPAFFCASATLTPFMEFARDGAAGPAMYDLVFGTVRETEPVAAAYAAFCISQQDGRIRLRDVEAPFAYRSVNRCLPSFLKCMDLFVAQWLHPDCRAPALAAALLAVDDACLADENAFWSEWLEELASDI